MSKPRCPGSTGPAAVESLSEDFIARRISTPRSGEFSCLCLANSERAHVLGMYLRRVPDVLTMPIIPGSP